MAEEKYMKMAIELAKKGVGFVNPNPMVGAVIVKDDKIIGQGYHEKFGQLHAERNALAKCVGSIEGATIYVTLEPCCHYGMTPPCTQAIIESKITKVVIGSKDPNPLVAGKGIEMLRQSGIEVVEDVLKEKCNILNEVFFHFIRTQTPFVVMKYAMTMDGKIATYTGESKWITGEVARQNVHQDRHRYSAIMVGVNTVIADDPMLTCRMEFGKDPLRIICDTNLRIPHTSQIILSAATVPTWIATSCMEQELHKPLIQLGCKIVPVPSKDGHIDLNKLMLKLGEMKVDSIFLEGGSELNYSALQSGIVNKVQTYIAPKLFGGKDAKTAVAGIGVKNPKDAFYLSNSRITLLGGDILIESEVVNNVHRNR